MPWKQDGTFVRINPDFEGNVWNDDQNAGIKVIATRHDFHDNDIAGGIQACLNIDGLNEMQADLNMGGFKVINSGTDGDEEVSDGIFLPTLNAGFTLGPKHGGSWVRQGRFVTVFCYIDYSTNPAQDNVPFVFGNLPFTIAAPNSGDPKQYPLNTFAGWNNVDLSGRNVDGSPEVFTRQLAAPSAGSDGKNVSAWRYVGLNNVNAGGAPLNENVLVELDENFYNVVGEFTFSFSYLTNDAQP